jgi:hypothetical protein
MQCPKNRLSFKQFAKVLACACVAWLSPSLAEAAPTDAPSVVTESQSVNAVIGESVTLSVEVEGAHPMRYCWRKGGEVLAGETGAKLKIKNALPSSAGEYTVEVVNAHGMTVSAPIDVQVCAPSLRIYRHHGIKLTFKARKCVRYTIECKNLLSHATAWNWFAEIENKNGTVRLVDHAAASQRLCVFRLKAEGACRCDGGHDEDNEDQDEDRDDEDDD